MWQDVAQYIQARTVVSPSGCWLWQLSHGTRGYGQVTVLGKQWAAHRLMLCCKEGRWLLDGECALHRCDVRSCCNPEHLFVGTQRDNVLDAAAKGRLHAPHARRVEAALLAGATNKSALAREIGCDVRTVFRVARRLKSA